MQYFLVDSTNDHQFEQAFRQYVNWTEEAENADAFIVFGGDGALLNAINRFHGLGRPFIGVHAGTRGFLMNNVENPVDFHQDLDSVAFHELWMLAGQATTATETFTIQGFNDIWVERATSQTLRMKLSINGVSQPTVLIGDGVLFCTPQGSTGYNLALRGKALAPGVPIIQVNPMSCVVNKSPLGSLLLADTAVIEVEFLLTDKRPGKLIYDGFSPNSQPIEHLKVWKGDRTVKIGLVERYSLLNKVLAWQLHF